MSLSENGFKTLYTHCGAWGDTSVHDDRVAKSLTDSAWATTGVSLPCVCECHWVGELFVYMETSLTTATTSGQKHWWGGGVGFVS